MNPNANREEVKSPEREFSQLPYWRCHKHVMACKCSGWELIPESIINGEGVAIAEHYLCYPVDAIYAPIPVQLDVFARNFPKSEDGSFYYVKYADGSEDWSTVQAFEEVYVLLCDRHNYQSLPLATTQCLDCGTIHMGNSGHLPDGYSNYSEEDKAGARERAKEEIESIKEFGYQPII